MYLQSKRIALIEEVLWNPSDLQGQKSELFGCDIQYMLSPSALIYDLNAEFNWNWMRNEGALIGWAVHSLSACLLNSVEAGWDAFARKANVVASVFIRIAYKNRPAIHFTP